MATMHKKRARAIFSAALKEASYIQTGSSQVVMSMGVQVRENLWKSTMTMGNYRDMETSIAIALDTRKQRKL